MNHPVPSRFVDDYLLYLLARASHTVSAEFHLNLRRAGLSVPVWRVLASLTGAEPQTVTGLADACLLQQPTMTKLLDRMVRDGLVRRLPDPRDRRVVRIEMTAKGQELVREPLQAAKRHETQLMERFPNMDGEALKDLLRDIIARPARARRAPVPVPA